jgi:hypothetical protein
VKGYKVGISTRTGSADPSHKSHQKSQCAY